MGRREPTVIDTSRRLLAFLFCSQAKIPLVLWSDVGWTAIKREQVSWPQYCDPKGRENAFAQGFNVHALPTMWLVDRKGVLRHLNADKDFPSKVKSLLEN